MKLSKIAALAAAAVALVSLVSVGPADARHGKSNSTPSSCPELNAIDPDSDGAMTLREALRAAKKAFARINPDNDRTLETNELAGRMSPKAIAAADTIIKDGKIGLLEYLIEVKNRFRWANPDKDRTIECDELHTKYGRLLHRLLK